MFKLKDGVPYSPDCSFGCYRCSDITCKLNVPVRILHQILTRLKNYFVKVWSAILQQIAALTEDQLELLRSYNGQRWSGPFGLFSSQPLNFPVQQNLAIIANKAILKNLKKVKGKLNCAILVNETLIAILRFALVRNLISNIRR